MIPLGIRWALAMAALVAVTMSLTAMVLYQRQYAAMLDQATGYGGSLTKLVAVQTAVPLLGEDWAAIDVFIQETQSRQEFPYLLVVDHRGVIRGSNDAKQVGTQYKPPQATPMPAHDPAVTVQSYRLPDNRAVLDFDTPVLFQSKEIGRIHLGLFEAPLTKVANLMLVLLTILTLVTSAAVAGGTYLLAQRLAGPIRVLRNSLKELAQRPLRLPDRRQAQRRVRGALFRLRQAPPPRSKSAMKPRLLPLQRKTTRTLCALCWIAVALALHGCATPPPAPAARARGKGGRWRGCSRATTNSRSSSPAPATTRRASRNNTSATRAKTGG